MGPSVFGHLGTRKDCPDCWDVMISGAEAFLYQCMVKYLVLMSCVLNRGVSAFQRSELEGPTVLFLNCRLICRHAFLGGGLFFKFYPNVRSMY